VLPRPVGSDLSSRRRIGLSSFFGYVKIHKDVGNKRGDLMKPRRLLLVVLAILSVTASSAVVASAQDNAQQAQSADLALPTNATGNYDTGGKQVIVNTEGQTDNKSSRQTGEPQPTARVVSIGDNFFEPADAAIEPGDTVTWTNNGAVPHTVTADNGLFDSGVLNPGESYTVDFDGQGTVTYYCTIHPEMRGSLTVGGG
jgi:plastocyanin